MIDARDTALIFEGGGMRNSYTAPWVGKLAHEQVQFGWVGGVSAGATLALNFASRDGERAKTSFTDFMGNPKAGGVRSLLAGTGLLNGQFIYEEYQDLLPFDLDTFNSTEEEVHLEAVRADTGETVTFKRANLSDQDTINLAARASSTMPIVMKMREIDGVPFVDGALGTSGGLLIQAAKDAGYSKFVVILTRPENYFKQPVSRPAVIKRMLRKHPAVAEAMLARPERYNASKRAIQVEEAAGNAFVFYPEDMQVSSTELNVEKLHRNYAVGEKQMEAQFPQLREFLVQR